MPRATTCKLNNLPIEVELALQLRDNPKHAKNESLDFRCVECNKPVRPFKESKNGAAHFEHDERNPKCRLSDPAR